VHDPVHRGACVVGVGQNAPALLEQDASGIGEFDSAGGAFDSVVRSSFSNLVICWLKAGCAMCSRSAARRKFISSATATK